MSAHDELEFSINELEVFLFRAPSKSPVRTSFGTMNSRPAILLRVSDRHGCFGWGEVWCNFPSVGAEHRAGLALAYLRPLLVLHGWESPIECFEYLTRKLEILAIQSGEFGPMAQIVAGVDMAIWDLVARRRGQPLWRLLGSGAQPDRARVQVYASGINPDASAKTAELKLAEGYRAFKLKVGFGATVDEANLRSMREVIGGEASLMADANQAWTLEQAEDAGRRMEKYNLTWLEEPIRANSSQTQWAQLARNQPVRLAAGENFAGFEQFSSVIDGAGVLVIQPDVGKWGGFSGCLKVAYSVVSRGKWLCPHWLGAGVGQVAALHLKAAVGGPGYVEVDANPNPLRERLMPPLFVEEGGWVTLAEQPGLGFEPDISACSQYLLRIPPIDV